MAKPSELKSIKVLSNGRNNATKIVDKDGKPIGCVQSIDIHMSTGEAFASADLIIVLPEVEAEIYDVILNDKRTIEDEIYAEEFFEDFKGFIYEIGRPDPIDRK